MKTTKQSLATVATVALAAVCGFAQTPEVKPTPTYDAEIAKRFGGNDNGMKGYTFVMLRTGPNDDKYKGTEREEMFKGHFANINKMADAGKLLLAGPFDKNDQKYRGLFIFTGVTADEVKKLMEGDPTIKNGIFVTDIVPWYGSAAVMAIPEIHPKLIKPKP